jgi:plastocyanin
MQFSTLALAALSIGSSLGMSPEHNTNIISKINTDAISTVSAQSAVTVHVIKVGSTNGTLAYFPNNIKAAVGDMIQFQFAPANHTVTQSTFDQPCAPINMFNKNVTGFYSGFMPVTASSTTTPTYTIMVQNTTPMWIYCSQGKHCQNGMTMVVNEKSVLSPHFPQECKIDWISSPTANATRTLANFQALAAKATVNLPGSVVEGGIAGTNGTSTTSSNPSSTSGAVQSTGSSAAHKLGPVEGVVGVVGLVMGAFLL